MIWKWEYYSYYYMSLGYFNTFPVIIALHYDSYIENRWENIKTWELPSRHFRQWNWTKDHLSVKIHVQLLKKQRHLKHSQVVLASCRCKDGADGSKYSNRFFLSFEAFETELARNIIQL